MAISPTPIVAFVSDKKDRDRPVGEPGDRIPAV